MNMMFAATGGTTERAALLRLVLVTATVGCANAAQLPPPSFAPPTSTSDTASVVSVVTAALGCVVLATMMAAVCTFCGKKEPEEPGPNEDASGT